MTASEHATPASSPGTALVPVTTPTIFIDLSRYEMKPQQRPAWMMCNPFFLGTCMLHRMADVVVELTKRIEVVTDISMRP